MRGVEQNPSQRQQERTIPDSPIAGAIRRLQPALSAVPLPGSIGIKNIPHSMNIRKRLRPLHAMMAFAMTIALAFPCIVQAVGIGEIVLQSRLGEPLLAQVDLMADSGERIVDTCLSLSPPDPHEDSSGYLTQADLTLKTEGKRRYVVISSRKPLNDAFARLRLQVKCPGMGSVIKTFTVLPDLSLPAPQAVSPLALAEAENISAPPSPGARDLAPGANPRDTLGARAEKHLSGKATRPANKRSPPAQSAGKKPRPEASFRLKLSAEPIDESRIGKISAEERAALLAQHKMLDADDQMASFLALQHQVKQMQSELLAIKLQLAQLGAVPSIAASSLASSVPAATGTTGAQTSQPKPAIAAKQPVAQPGKADMQQGLFAALGLLLAILVLWFGLRRHTRIKSRAGVRSQAGVEPIRNAADNASARKAAIAPAVQAHLQAPSSPVKAAHAPAAPSQASTSGMDALFSSPKKIGEEAPEEDSMLEEAGLYAAHGRPAKAIEILQEIIKRYPAKVEAWPLLLSIYSSLGNAAEFEKTAREFLKHHKNSPSWNGIQALGRTLDRENSLYADNNDHLFASSLLPDEPPHPGKGVALDFVLDSTPQPRVFDLDLGSTTAEDKPPDLALGSSFLAFPELNLDVLNDKPAGKKADTE